MSGPGALEQGGPLPAGRVARIGLEVLDALAAAHRAGILHRHRLRVAGLGTGTAGPGPAERAGGMTGRASGT
jgi:hypothetical protein